MSASFTSSLTVKPSYLGGNSSESFDHTLFTNPTIVSTFKMEQTPSAHGIDEHTPPLATSTISARLRDFGDSAGCGIVHDTIRHDVSVKTFPFVKADGSVALDRHNGVAVTTLTQRSRPT